jgi:hypothetical protein
MNERKEREREQESQKVSHGFIKENMKYSSSERSWVDKTCILEFLYEFALLSL